MLNSIAQRNHPHIAKLLATYYYKSHYHLLFPWAPCNLRGFWDNNPKPGWDRVTVLWMLEQLKGVTSSLCEVHNFKINKPNTLTLAVPAADRSRLHLGSGGDISVAEDEFRCCCHGDLKPENILWSNELEDVGEMGVLQIADFGLGRFHGRASRSEMLAKSSIASPTYEPPEIPLNRNVSRAYDIWSLGCIFLEFITWRLGGLPLINAFHNFRTADGGDGTSNDKFFTVINYKEPGQEAVVRKEVLDWIERLRKHQLCSGALQELLALVRDRMLVIFPKRRIGSNDLLDHFVRLLNRARVDSFFLLGNTPEDVENIQNTAGPNSQTTPKAYERPQIYIVNEYSDMVRKHGAPEITERQETTLPISSRFSLYPRRPRRESDNEAADNDIKGPLGLNTLYNPPDPAIADLIFIHGLGGGSRSTWSKNHDPNLYWPQEWLPKDAGFRDVRIHSFGYSSNWGKQSTLTIYDFAKSLLGEIHDCPVMPRDSNVRSLLYIIVLAHFLTHKYMC